MSTSNTRNLVKQTLDNWFTFSHNCSLKKLPDTRCVWFLGKACFFSRITFILRSIDELWFRGVLGHCRVIIVTKYVLMSSTATHPRDKYVSTYLSVGETPVIRKSLKQLTLKRKFSSEPIHPILIVVIKEDT